MSNYTRRELMFDTPYSGNVKLQVALFLCVCWQHLSGRGSQCSDGWLSVLSDYVYCLYFPFEPRKVVVKLLTCSESHYVSTSMCLGVPFYECFVNELKTENAGLLYFKTLQSWISPPYLAVWRAGSHRDFTEQRYRCF